MREQKTVDRDTRVQGQFYHLWRENHPPDAGVDQTDDTVYYLRGHNNKQATAKGGALKVKNRAQELLRNGRAFAVIAWLDESDAVNRPDRWVSNVFIAPEYISVNHTGKVLTAKKLR